MALGAQALGAQALGAQALGITGGGVWHVQQPTGDETRVIPADSRKRSGPRVDGGPCRWRPVSMEARVDGGP
ncbi:hypothetical protein Mal15_08810 [Stieleria maiorica]|uniref:Uncharacterized protein n=1 Tax=Stieleria maiorica TaxID=2795974 RepID=A0A5B9M6P2_9BACT|nr:hypothetical protein Mal15_08810 [Stieleria maiorica]